VDRVAISFVVRNRERRTTNENGERRTPNRER